jgi:hypothetical protein
MLWLTPLNFDCSASHETLELLLLLCYVVKMAVMFSVLYSRKAPGSECCHLFRLLAEQQAMLVLGNELSHLVCCTV